MATTPADENYGHVDVDNYTGAGNARFKTALYKLALTKPSVYYDMRTKVLETLKNNATKDLYNTFYNVLLYGKDKDGKPLFIDVGTGKENQPQIPLNKVNSFSLSAVMTLAEYCDDLIEMLMPKDPNKILSVRFAEEGKAAPSAPSAP